MAHQIWKYPIETTDNQTILMPQDCEVLCVQLQGKFPQVWVKVDTDKPLVERHFEVFGTGHEMNPDYNRKYIGTYQLQNGALVFHLFELIPA